MKKLFIIALTALTVNTTHAANEIDCTDETLTGVLQANKTLFANVKYLVTDCYRVDSGYTLTIQPGTQIFFDKATHASLVIDRGAQIDAQGTPSLPIILTSAMQPGFHNYGDWDGLIIIGRAETNATGNRISVPGTCTSLLAGGNVNTDNSGIIEHMQIHFAENGLTLAGVGSNTSVSYVQTTHTAKNAYQFLGGTVNASHLVSLNAARNAYFFSDGYIGKLQFLAGLHEDATAHDPIGSYGIFVQNDLSNSANTPYTRPVIANATMLGVRHCNTSPWDSDFKDAVIFTDYARGDIYNSVFEGYRDNGLSIVGANAIANTAANNLNFSYNAFADMTADVNSPVWTSGCDASMDVWFDGSSILGCRETGNQPLGTVTTGYDPGNICGLTSPDLRPDMTSTLDAPDYSASALSDPFFNDEFTYRGAFDDATNWIESWTDFKPQETEYCPQAKLANLQALPTQKDAVKLYPNPAKNITQLAFETQEKGAVTIQVIDKITGRILQQNQTQLPAGKQLQHLNLNNLRPGTYLVRIIDANQHITNTQVMVNE